MRAPQASVYLSLEGYVEAYSQPFQTSKMELFAKIVNSFQLLKVHKIAKECLPSPFLDF